MPLKDFPVPAFPRRREQKIETLVCWERILRRTRATGRGDGWRFPSKVEKLLRHATASSTVLHLFGGKAAWGVRLDIDPSVHPQILGDAWRPPFRADSFDVVILDPPYFQLENESRLALLEAAAWIARERVVWFHTFWIDGGSPLRFERGWLVRLAGNSQVRALQIFRPRLPKRRPREFVSRGPAVRYNHWSPEQHNFPFP